MNFLLKIKRATEENFGLHIFLRFVAAIFLVCVVFAITSYYYQKNVIRTRLIRDGTTYAQLLANTSRMAIFTEDESLFTSATAGFSDIADLQSAALYTAEGRLLFSAGPYPRHAGTKILKETTGRTLEKPFSLENEYGITFFCPIFSQASTSVEDILFDTPQKGPRVIEGWAEVSLNKKNIAVQLHALLITTSLTGFFILLFGTAITFPLLSKHAIKPLKRLAAGVDAVGRGAADTLPVESRDEVGRLTEAFNRLVKDLQNTGIEKLEVEKQLQQTQKMEAIGLLTGGIAHDFNNLLTVMLAHIEQMAFKTAKDSPTIPNLEKLEKCANQASALTKNLLMYSRMQPLKTEGVDLNDIIRNIKSLLEAVIGETVQVKVDLTEEPLPIMGDQHMIEQSIINLAMNAKDAMPLGGILKLSTSAISLDNLVIDDAEFSVQGRFALMLVVDTGGGMTEQIRKRIFDPFFTTKDIEKGGTGLGLNIVYGVVKKHKGFIDVISSPGKGTSFKIYLPLTNINISNMSPKKLHFSSGGSETILFVEDNSAVREVLSDGIRRAGYTVMEASDGMEAIEKFEDNIEAIDIIVCDVVMPRITGLDVYEKIRALKPDIKFLFVSGYTMDEVTTKALSSITIDFLAKPYNTATILKKLREILDRDKK